MGDWAPNSSPCKGKLCWTKGAGSVGCGELSGNKIWSTEGQERMSEHLRGDADLSIEHPLWLVVLTSAGPPVDPLQLRTRLDHYTTDYAFANGVRYRSDRLELTYWDEASHVQDAIESALLMWSGSRQHLMLPQWEVVGVEILERATVRERSAQGRGLELIVPGEIRAW